MIVDLFSEVTPDLVLLRERYEYDVISGKLSGYFPLGGYNYGDETRTYDILRKRVKNLEAEVLHPIIKKMIAGELNWDIVIEGTRYVHFGADYKVPLGRSDDMGNTSTRDRRRKMYDTFDFLNSKDLYDIVQNQTCIQDIMDEINEKFACEYGEEYIFSYVTVAEMIDYISARYGIQFDGISENANCL